MISTHKNRRYTIVPYDAKWADVFLEEEKKLRLIFSERAVAVEHIGSTVI